MIVQTVSLKDPNENYLSCKSNGNLRFDLVDLDPSCIFFMVPMGAGRTCLKGPNGKFIDLHNASFRCDGVTTGAALIFDDKILKLDSGRYLSNVVVDETIAVSSDATKLEIKATSFESFNVNMSLSVPTVTYNSNVLIENRYRPGKNYLALENSSGTIDISFSIPYSMDGERNGTVEVIFNHMRDNNSGGVIDVELNDQPVSQSYAPPTSFEVESIYTSTLSSLSGENRLSITLSQGVSGTYCFSDAALVFRDQDGYLKQQNSMYALGLSSGSSYNDGKLEKGLREGNPYLTLEGGSSWSKITFTVREELLGIGNCVIKIQNRRELDTSIDVYLNGNKIEDRYDNIPTDSFGTSTLAIHSNQLERSNELVIKPVDGKYYISDVSVDVVSILPDVTEESFGSYIKEWILLQRPNIGQLHKIPRDDFPAWKFVSEAPYWFFLPFLPVSPQEISVLFDYYNMLFVSVAFEVRDYNNKARDFHRELLSTDIPRKNALRHAYWTAMLSRRWGLYFALDLSTAHEEAHVDLTIEGPFDHVTDKINNAVGSLLGSRTSKSEDLEQVIDAAWDNEELAHAKDFRETAAGQTAQVHWQWPLNRMAMKYNVKPRFSESEKATLKRMGVTEPDVPIIH